jgi:hypothetical protein
MTSSGELPMARKTLSVKSKRVISERIVENRLAGIQVYTAMVYLWLQAEKSGEFVTEKLFELQISNRLASPSLLVGSWVHFY